MAVLPRYQRIGVSARQPEQLNFANVQESVRLGQNISQQVNRMSDFAFKQGADDARVRGEELIRTDGALPTLANIQSKGGPRSIAEKSAYALGSQVAVAQVQADAEIDIMRILNDGEQNQTSFSEVQSRLRDVTDGYSSSLADVDPGAAMLLQSRLNGAVGKAEQRYSNYYVGVQASRAAKTLENTADLKVNQILTDVIQPGHTMEMLESSISEAATLLRGLGATEDQLEIFQTSTLKSAYKEKTFFLFNKMPIDEQKATLDVLLTTPMEGMSLEETQTFRTKLSSGYRNNLRAQTSEVASIVADINAQNQILAKGGMPLASTISTLTAKAANLGEAGALALETVKRLEFNAEKAAVYRQMTVVDLAAEVKRLEGGMPQIGGEGRDQRIEVDTYNSAVSYLSLAQKRLNSLNSQEKESFQPLVDAANDAVSVLKGELDAGAELSPGALINLRNEIGKIPERLRGELARDISSLEFKESLSSDLFQSTPKQLESFISNFIESGLPAKPTDEGDIFEGAPGVDTPFEYEIRDLAQKMLSNMTAELKADPIAFASKVGITNGMGVNYNITPIDFTDPDAASEQIERRIRDARLVSGKYGSPIKFLTDSDTLAVNNILETGTMGDQMIVLGLIVDGAGQDAPKFLEEISKQSPFFAQVGSLISNQTGSGMASAESALKGQVLIDGKVGPAEFTPGNTNETFRDLTSAALQFLPEGLSSVMLTAKAIYADVARSDKFFDQSKWSDSINRAMGADINAGTGGVQEVRDLNTYIFPGFTSDNYEDALEAAIPQDILASIYGASLEPEMLEALGGFKRGTRADQNAYTSGSDDYNLVYAGGNNYFIKYKNQQTILDTEGEAVLIDMRKLIEMTLP